MFEVLVLAARRHVDGRAGLGAVSQRGGVQRGSCMVAFIGQTALQTDAPAAERWMVTEDIVPRDRGVAFSATVARNGVPGLSIVVCGATQSAVASILLPTLTVVAVNEPRRLPDAADRISRATASATAAALARQLIEAALGWLIAPDSAQQREPEQQRREDDQAQATRGRLDLHDDEAELRDTVHHSAIRAVRATASLLAAVGVACL